MTPGPSTPDAPGPRRRLLSRRAVWAIVLGWGAMLVLVYVLCARLLVGGSTGLRQAPPPAPEGSAVPGPATASPR